MSIDVMTMMVKAPVEKNWGKLNWLLCYICGTLYIPLILQSDSLNIINWLFGGAFIVPDDSNI